MTIWARICWRVAWYETPWAWLPAEAAMTPRGLLLRGQEQERFSAPRSLKEPVICRFSSLNETLQPVRREKVSEVADGDR
jgi:hypothetical protein